MNFVAETDTENESQAAVAATPINALKNWDLVTAEILGQGLLGTEHLVETEGEIFWRRPELSSASDPGRDLPPAIGPSPALDWSGARNHPSLTSAVRDHVSILRAIVATKALNGGVRVTRFLVDVETDPEEDTARLVLRTQLDANPQQTVAFWKSLDTEVGRWADALGHDGRGVLASQVGLRFHWSRR